MRKFKGKAEDMTKRIEELQKKLAEKKKE